MAHLVAPVIASIIPSLFILYEMGGFKHGEAGSDDYYALDVFVWIAGSLCQMIVMVIVFYVYWYIAAREPKHKQVQGEK